MGWQFLDISMLRDIELFTSLSDHALTDIVALTTTEEYKPADRIFQEGDKGDAMYLILKGEVRISKDIPGVGEEALAFLSDGAYFGEMSLVGDESPRSASAIASSPVKVARLSRVDFQKLLDENKEAAVEILTSFVNTLAERLRASNDKLAFFAMSDMFE
ncbi:cyclic nucleotide-binding domain-containing protein [Persicimonas caeni]|uniref:Cyclic nucleotide-binding domain-containing protein n=1 Tax=Persicimonas caeni TaxID=2292766 RepID=A0A4Y6PQB3_PERCE|nr:cyclic nucleotide-binding domain-containing protein [Persicimonas caeni]QDG50299.1 cyclic nucleotide-binding domain-containing protein [Persicimonas caeni]QED31520.1 cyclic nucleotide-binding domain-containing protein [Persicimonas caeni]